jgi:hypothetical protein
VRVATYRKCKFNTTSKNVTFAFDLNPNIKCYAKDGATNVMSVRFVAEVCLISDAIFVTNPK